MNIKTLNPDLITDEIIKKLPPFYSTEEFSEVPVKVKFSHPLSGWKWYALEGEPVKDIYGQMIDVEFFGFVEGFYPELGYFTLSELNEVNAGGVFVEREPCDNLSFRKTDRAIITNVEID